MSFTSTYKRGSVGVEYAQNELRYIQLTHHRRQLIPKIWGVIPCTETARIDQGALRKLRSTLKTRDIAFAIPTKEVTTILLPIKKDVAAISDAVYALLEQQGITRMLYRIEYAAIASTPTTILVVAYAVPTALVNEYVRAIKTAGLTPTALIVEGHAQARALTTAQNDPVLIVSIDEHSTAIAIVAHGVALFSTSIPFGGAQLVALLTKASDMTSAQARSFLFGSGVEESAYFVPLTDTLTTLVEETRQAYVYWHEKKRSKDIDHAVRHILVTGTYGNIKGLSEYFAAQLRLPVEVGNPWLHCLSFEHTIPELSRTEAGKYTTAIGLALGHYPLLNLLPSAQKQLLRDRRAVHRTLAIIGVVVLAVVLGFGASLLFR